MWRNAARRLSGAAAGMATAAGSAHVSSAAAAALRSGAVASASAPSVVARDLRCFKDSGSLLDAPNRSRRFGYYRNDYRPPPPNNYRRAPPALPNMEGERMLWSIMGANAFVFACWHALDPRLMQQNFLVSEESVYAGRVHTIVTSAFSHYNLGHLGANMLALYYFGRDLSRIFGPKYLLNLYLAGGVAASATHVAWCRWERERRQSRRRGFIAQRAGRWMENTAGYLTTPPALVGRPNPDESAPYRSKRLLEPPGVRDGGCPRAGVPIARPDGVDGGARSQHRPNPPRFSKRPPTGSAGSDARPRPSAPSSCADDEYTVLKSAIDRVAVRRARGDRANR